MDGSSKKHQKSDSDELKSEKGNKSQKLIKSKKTKKDILNFPTIARHPVSPRYEYPSINVETLEPYQEQLLLTELAELAKTSPVHPKVWEIFVLAQAKHQKCCG